MSLSNKPLTSLKNNSLTNSKLICHCYKNTGMITVEDFLFTEDKHKLSDYPDEGSVDKVGSFFLMSKQL